MTDKTDNNPILIFHRAKANAYDSLSRQQEFLESYKKHLPITAIDYVTGNERTAKELIDLVKRRSNKLIIIMQSPLTEDEYIKQYDLHILFRFCKVLDRARIYQMDSEGKLYAPVKNIEDVRL